VPLRSLASAGLPAVLGTHVFLEFHFPGLCWQTVLGFWCSRSFRSVCFSGGEEEYFSRFTILEDSTGARSRVSGERAEAARRKGLVRAARDLSPSGLTTRLEREVQLGTCPPP